jgi:uncharacterized membrane protein YtjA (UPF0391 family)
MVRSRRDFVPGQPTNFVVSAAGTGRNFRFEAGLFPQLMHGAVSGADRKRNGNKGAVMLSWVVTFLIIALIAGILGFGGVAGASIEIAKAIFFIAIILFLVSAVIGLARGRTRV